MSNPGPVQYGGVFIKGTPEAAFDHFVSKSIVERISTGRSGSVFRLTYTDDPAKSPYTSSSVYTWMEPVTSIAVKIMAVSNTGQDVWRIRPNEEKDVESIDDFLREVLYHTDIFLKSASELQQLTPAPLFAKVIYEKTDNLQFIHKLRRSIDTNVSSMMQENTNKEIMGFVNAINEDRITSLGIIVMELACRDDDFLSLSLFRIVGYDIRKDLARLQIINMAIKTGYLHLDFHTGNIFIRRMGSKGTDVYIIDFGRCIKLPEPIRRKIEALFEAGRYRELLDEFRNFEDRDGDPMSDWATKQSYYGYEWFWDPYEDMADAVKELEQSYQEKRKAMKKINLSETEYHASLTKLYLPPKNVVNRRSSPESRLALESVQDVHRTASLNPGIKSLATYLYPSKMLAVSQAAAELSEDTAEIASILEDVTDKVSKKMEKKLQDALAAVESSEKKLAAVIADSRTPPQGASAKAVFAPMSSSPITVQDTIKYVLEITSGAKVTKKQAANILRETFSPISGAPISRARSLPSRKRSARSNRQTRRHKSW